MKKKLVLITDGFPFGIGEKTFIEPEIPYLIKEFNLTIIADVSGLPNWKKESVRDERYQLITYDYHTLSFAKALAHAVKENSLEILKIDLGLIKRKSCKKNNIFSVIKRNGVSIKYWMHGILFSYWLHINKDIILYNDTLIYSFWGNTKALGCAMSRGELGVLKLITRLHGYDLYDERIAGYRQPYKWYVNKVFDQMIFACEYGYKYYASRFSENLKKYHLNRLGIQGGFKNRSEWEIWDHENDSITREEFHLVSCSNIIPIKRVELIAEALLGVKKKIKWDHFGDGSSKTMINEICTKMPNNIEVTLHGRVCSEEIYHFYAMYHPNCFITTSSSEGGCPVSIQEALSFGMPIIATDVGGITEMFNNNGVLLMENPSVKDVRNAIEWIISCDSMSLHSMKVNSFCIWEKMFRIDDNASELLGILTSL